MKSNRVILMTLSLLIGIGVMTGCVNKEKLSGTMNSTAITTEKVDQEQVAENTEANIILQGSMNVLPLMLELTQSLPYDVTAVGKEAAIEAVNLKTTQLALYDGTLEEAQGVSEIIAYAGILLIVNPGSGLENITSEEVRAFFTGETTEIQGKALTMVLPDKSLPSRTLLEEFFPLKGDVNGMQKSLIPDTALTAETGVAVMEAVAKDPNAIGVILVGELSAQVKGLKLEGIEANEGTLGDGSYVAAKPVVLNADASNEEAFHKFIDLAKSETGKAAIQKIGFVPSTN